MKLKELLSDNTIYIEYRTVPPDIELFKNNRDILLGFCAWKDNKLIPLDMDAYSVEDEIVKYEWDGVNNLIVYVEKDWIIG